VAPVVAEAVLPPKSLAEVDATAPGLEVEGAAPVPEDSTALDIDLSPSVPQGTVLEETLASSADHEVPATSPEEERQPEVAGEFDIAALSVAAPSANHVPEEVVEAPHEIAQEEEGAIEGSSSEFDSAAPLTLGTLPIEDVSPAPVASAPHTLASLPVDSSTPVASRPATPPPVFEPTPPRSLPRKPKVLVVDDSPTVCKLVTITLSNRGYHVMSSPDGAEAISELAQSKPDLILMDITMPKLDGYKLCKLVTSHPSTKHIPVVMLSGKDGFFDKTRGKFAGCVDYITKPFDPENLLRVVNEYLPQPESARGASVAGQMRIRAGGG
jgi:twitching motility two-component system response regulator PilG